ncbi:MAG: threonine synthase [Chloroflexia bacterium]|jgi:threonine synthase|nr:threonine synthase [Chloroflexia bacterium]
MTSYLTHLECSNCANTYPADHEQHLCAACGGILLAHYDLARIKAEVPRQAIEARPWSEGLWRYAELLPVSGRESRVTLGEGATPLLPLDRLSEELDVEVLLKDEGLNPTGTFKPRGAAVGVSRAKELGATTIALPTAGNAGAAWAAYGARAGLPVVVAMPKDAPPLTQQEVRIYGARLHLVDGLISDAGRWVAEGVREHGWYDASTFKEPYRLEGKKTLGLEIAEQLGWSAPDVILYPTGGGVGLLGLWKAFLEMAELGWLQSDKMPRLVVVQSTGCAPVVRAWENGETITQFWEGASTIAAGLRVPSPLSGPLMLRALHETNGTALAVDDADIRRSLAELSGMGFWLCPEGAALLPALRRLRAQNWITPGERVVLLNTGAGLVYPEVEPDDGRSGEW